jgi:hypothetical protein
MENRREKFGQLIYSLFGSTAFLTALCIWCVPLWETNDDVGMSMAAHGYGIASTGTANIIFSNVIWGHLIRSMPIIFGILGYSTVTLLVLAVCGVVILYTLQRSNFSRTLSFLILSIVLLRPVLFAQFTINSGLLMVCAVLLFMVYARENDFFLIFVGCILAFASYLVRSEEFFVLLFISLPLLPLRKFRADRSAIICVAILSVSVLAAHFYDRISYSGPEWKPQIELKSLATIIDFGGGPILKDRPDILAEYGYSKNDIDLLSNWFFVDKKIVDFDKISLMLHAIGPMQLQNNSISNATLGIKEIFNREIVLLVAFSIISLICKPSLKVVVSWILFFLSVFLMGISGRPGIMRVYYPITCLLLLAPLVLAETKLRYKNMYLLTLLLFSAVNSFHLIHISNEKVKYANSIKDGLRNFPTDVVVSWGAVFPFESVFPVLTHEGDTGAYNLYSLGGFALAPFTRSYSEEHSGRDFVTRLLSKQGIPIIAQEGQFQLLDKYCREHLNGHLLAPRSTEYGELTISWRKCEIDR